MGVMNWLRRTVQTGTVRIPLTPQEARDSGRAFAYQRDWVCRCGARLRIRAREDRDGGASNFESHLTRGGHATRASHELTWDGLAAERGWRTDPVTCPACHRGMTVAAYRRFTRGE